MANVIGFIVPPSNFLKSYTRLEYVTDRTNNGFYNDKKHFSEF